MPFHSDEAIGSRHAPHQWEYADAAARTGATGFVASDIGKTALQLDDYSRWALTAITPTWKEILTAGNTVIGDVATLAAGKFWIGSSGGSPEPQTMSGDGTLSSSGALTVSNITIASSATGDTFYRASGGSITRLGIGTSGQALIVNSGATAPAWSTLATGVQGVSFFLPGTLYVGENLLYTIVPKSCAASTAYISVLTAPTSANVIVDINYHANDMRSVSTIFTTSSNRPTITSAGYYGSAGGTPDVVNIAAGGIISLSVDQIGSTVAGADLCVTLVMA